MAAAEARRRMKADLQAQLDRITAQEEEERYSRQPTQHEQSRSYQSQSNAGPSYRASSSTRQDVISPPWSQSQTQAQSQSQQSSHTQRSEWGSVDDRRNGSSSRHRDEHTHSQSSHSGFRSMPDPVPMITTSQTSGPSSAPWQRNGSSSVQSRQSATATYTPPTPDTPNMPNPLSASFVSIPVPSKHQLHEYLVTQQKQPLGLGMGWSIEGHIFDVYDLFVAVVRLGGSSTVSRREWWPTLAVMLGIPPSINTPHGLRASAEAARQLFAFFSLHLGTLEKLWESTGSNDTFGKGVESRMRPPVSSARGDGEEPRNQPSTYPPPPPQHRESSSSQYNRNGQYTPVTSQPGLSTSMPLHIHPSEPSSTPLALQQPPVRKNLPSAKSRQQSNNGVNGTSYTRGQPGQAPSVSPVLHHPAPARLDSEVAPTTIDPRLIPIQKPPSQIGTRPQTDTQQVGSSTKTLGVPPLSGYNPPKFASFDHLVATNALTLPKLPPQVVLNLTGTETEIYAKRCFELRGVVKKIQAKEQARQVSKEEMTFWQKLLAILRHNPSVVIPGSQPMSTENVPHVPLPASQQILDNAVAGPSTAPELSNGQPPKKKRGRKPKNADSISQPASMEIGPNGELVPSTQGPPAKRTRGPGKPKPQKIAPAAPESNVDAAASTGAAPPDATTSAPASLAADPISEGSQIVPDTTASQAAPSSTQAPKPRKPYTIRVGPDGTPLSKRFQKRLETGILGYVEVVRDSQAAPSDFTGSQGDREPSTLYAAASADDDALGEVDPDLDIARFEGPNGLAAFDAAIGYRDEDFAGERPPQLGGSSTGPGTNGHVDGTAGTSTSGSASDNAPKVKNPKTVEASKLRWERRRQEQAAARLAAGEQPITGWPVGVPTKQAGEKKRGGFGAPGAAIKAANKRWSLQHAALTSGSTSSSSAGVFRATPSTPMVISSPKRIISLSSGPALDRESTPLRSTGSELLRHRAGSLKPRSSLPLHLTPSRRDWSPFESQEMEVNGQSDSFVDVEWLPEPAETTRPGQSSGSKNKGPTGKTKAVVDLSNKAKGPRSSLPNQLIDSRLSNMGPPLSTERPARDKGKTVDRNLSTPEPSRFIQTRREKAAMPKIVIRQSRHSLPSERAASVSLSRPTRASLSPARQSLPPSQPRLRLVPEIELITPRRYLRLSPVRPEPVKAEVSPNKVETRAKPRLSPVKVLPKPNARPSHKKKPTAGPKRFPRKYVSVVIPIRKRRRADLILKGIYVPFRDDGSDDESKTKRNGQSGLRPKVPVPRGSHARTARPQAPEIIVSRFVTRGIETELEERYRDVLCESTILKRTSEQECGWKGCDAVLASEWQLQRHVESRRHAAQGIFKAGIFGETTLYRCHWEDCEQPCFSSSKELEQHLIARHICRTLECPYPDCDLLFSALSHLTRHAVKHHDSPSDQPVPLADLSAHIPPPPFPDPPQHLPESARTDILTTPLVPGSIFKSLSRQEWCKLKVQNGSYAPDEPVLHIEHPPHILQPLGEGEIAGDTQSEVGSVFTDLEGGVVTEERLLDESLGRPKRRLVPVVDVKVGKKSKVGTAEDIVSDEVEAEDDQHPARDLSDVGSQDLANDGELRNIGSTQGDDSPAPLLAEEIPLDLGERPVLEDPLDTETTYSPLLGPRPDDILFDLSDDGSAGEGGDASESEVWAELEDQEMTEAFTPAGMLGDYEMSDDEDGGMDEDEEVGEEEIRAAILSDPLDSGIPAEVPGDEPQSAVIEDAIVTSEEGIAVQPELENEASNGTEVDMVTVVGNPLENDDTDPEAIEEVDISKPTAAITSPEPNLQAPNESVVEPEVPMIERNSVPSPAPVRAARTKQAPISDNVEKFTVTVTNRFAAIAESTSMDDEPSAIEDGAETNVVEEERVSEGEEPINGLQSSERPVDINADFAEAVVRDSGIEAAPVGL